MLGRCKQLNNNKEDEISGIAFAELVMYIEEVSSETSISPVFKLTDKCNSLES